MAGILWTSYQMRHITAGHDVTAQEFEQAWLDRDEPLVGEHPVFGPYYEGYGYTEEGRCLYLVWRWQHQEEEADAVWPVTAFEPEEEEDPP